jgi:hypothetical protein
LDRHDGVTLSRWELLRLLGLFGLLAVGMGTGFDADAIIAASAYLGLNLIALPFVRSEIPPPEAVIQPS